MGDKVGGFHSLKDSTKLKKKKKRRDHLAVGEDTGWRSAAGLVPELPLLLATMDTKALPDTETSC